MEKKEGSEGSAEFSGGVGRPRPTSDLPEREHLKRLAQVFAKNPIYFLTCCAAGRKAILTRDPVSPVIIDAFRRSPEIHGWVVGRYVLMPDHVHFFARARCGAKSLAGFVRDWKKWTAHEIVKTTSFVAPIWQPEFFYHLLRSADSYSKKWDYVRNNPVRAGLARTADAWPHSGECEPHSF